MMGGFQSNSAVFVAPWLLAGVLAAGAASPPAAGAAGAAADAAAEAEATDARVSTSPETNEAAPSPARPASVLANGAAAPPPLTRAAARQRVESISPVPWLARFGPVSLEHRE